MDNIYENSEKLSFDEDGGEITYGHMPIADNSIRFDDSEIED